MQNFIGDIPRFLVGAVILAGLIVSAPGFSQENNVRAKIAVQIHSKEKVTRARSRDRLRAGDLLTIVIHPETESFVWVVYSDKRTASLLYRTKEKIQDTTIVLPSGLDYFRVDGSSQHELVTIICSPKELPELDGLKNGSEGKLPYDRWASLEERLMEKSRISLEQETKKPFAIAGNVRGGSRPGDKGQNINEIPMYTGKHFLVKKYEFEIKK